MNYTLGVIACGTMGVSILTGLLDHLNTAMISCDPVKIYATVKSRDSQIKLENTLCTMPQGRRIEVLLSDKNKEVLEKSDVVILCSKPYLAEQILKEADAANALKGKILLSVLGGKTIAQLKELVPNTTVIRTMPNTPTRIREGVTAVASEGELDKKVTDLVMTIYQPLGLVKIIPESQMDTVTALCGSGPAFIFTMIDALVDGAVMMGLPRRDAIELASQTVQGSARMVQQTGEHPATLRDSVTTPGGCTIAGLLRMEEGAIRSTLSETVRTATLHAKGLGKK